MKQPTNSRKRRGRPADPAIFVWAAVALIALVPLEHAVAARLDRAGARLDRPATAAGAPATPAPAQVRSGAGTATP
jgi:hypothetical protein